MACAPFDLFNADAAIGPVTLAVPHAGRAYPALDASLAVPLAAVRALEDRYADRLIDRAVADGHAALIARTPRLWIDLNRAETEVDPAMIDGPVRAGPLSVKTRGGLGLVPRRLAAAGELWRDRMTAHDLAQRIADHHRPYHAALDTLLARARAAWRIAILIDIHSMPPIEGEGAAQIVIGDRHGASSDARFVAVAEQLFREAGLRTARNMPYAGGYVLERHGRPASAIHALQIEIDRRLYLDSQLDQPGPGLEAVQRLVATLATCLAESAVPRAMAAE